MEARGPKAKRSQDTALGSCRRSMGEGVTRTLCVMVTAAAAFLLVAPSPASAAPASNPTMIDLAPADYSVIPLTSSIEVQFTCPSYKTSYAGTKTYTSYFVHFGTSPLRTIEGDFSPRNEVGVAQAFPVPGTTETCGAFFAEPFTTTPDTYYWFVERINCDAQYCAEFSPLTSFAIVKPVPPGGSGKQPKGSTGGVRYLNAYIGCEANKNAERFNACTEFDTPTAFFESNQSVRYKLCVRTPKGKNHCSTHEAAPFALAITKINTNELGRYKVTWTAGGRTITRYVRMLP
jgi:hypothetical protein